LRDRQIGGLGAVEDLSGVNADLTIYGREAGSIGDQAAGRSVLTPRTDRRYGMARRQRHDLLAPDDEERIGVNDEPAGFQLDEGGEGAVDLGFGVGFQDRELHPLGVRRFLYVSDRGLSLRTVWAHEQGDHPGLGNQLGQQLEPLGGQLNAEQAKARDAAARPRETGDEA
jgi:hypothetical protein